MKAFVKKLMVCFYRILNIILPKSDRMVLFSTDNGKAAGGNPRAIFEYAVRDIARKELKYKLVWFLTDELLRDHPEEAERILDIAGKNDREHPKKDEGIFDSAGKNGREHPKKDEGIFDIAGKNGREHPKKAEGIFDIAGKNGREHAEESREIFDNVSKIDRNHPENSRKRAGLNKYNKINRSGAVCRIVRYGHPSYYWYMARAGVWIFDSRQEPYIVKRPGVKYLQTWHGTPLKKLGLDIDELNMAGEKRSIEAYKEAFRREAGQWDYLIAQNDFSAETFRRCFDFKGEILKLGYPHNDILVQESRRSLKTGYQYNEKTSQAGLGGLKAGKKTLLYAPTWRDDKYLAGGWYAFSCPLDFAGLHDLLGDEYRIIIKPHYLVKMRSGDIPEDMIKCGFVQVCGQSDEINDLYLAADALITDYSSAMFDYSLLGRPMFFFAYDMEEYSKKLRGFYFDLEEEAPGPIVKTTEELAAAVRKTFEKTEGDAGYNTRFGRFIEKYNMYDDGNAARKAWERVIG